MPSWSTTWPIRGWPPGVPCGVAPVSGPPRMPRRISAPSQRAVEGRTLRTPQNILLASAIGESHVVRDAQGPRRGLEAGHHPAPDRLATGRSDRRRSRHHGPPLDAPEQGVRGLMPRPAEPGRWRPQHGLRAYQRMRRRILDARGWRCEACGVAGRLELHHVTAVEDGGTDDPGNLRILCRPCHFDEHGRGPGPDRRGWRAEIARRLAE